MHRVDGIIAHDRRFPIDFPPQATHITFICPMRFDAFPLDTQVIRHSINYYYSIIFLVNWVKNFYLTKCFFYSISYTLFFLPHWGCNQTHFDYFVLKELLAQDTHTNISLISFNCRCASSRWAATHTTCLRWSSSRQTKSRGKLEEEQQNPSQLKTRGT